MLSSLPVYFLPPQERARLCSRAMWPLPCLSRRPSLLSLFTWGMRLSPGGAPGWQQRRKAEEGGELQWLGDSPLQQLDSSNLYLEPGPGTAGFRWKLGQRREGTFLRLNTNLPCSIHCISDRFIVDIRFLIIKAFFLFIIGHPVNLFRIEFTLIASGEETLGKRENISKVYSSSPSSSSSLEKPCMKEKLAQQIRGATQQLVGNCDLESWERNLFCVLLALWRIWLET